MASDVRVFTGTVWESIKGPAGPTVVSSDAGNTSRLGTDGRLFTPATAAARTIRTLAAADYTIQASDVENTLRNTYAVGDAWINLPTDAQAAIPIGSTVYIMSDTVKRTFIRPLIVGVSLFWQQSSGGTLPVPDGTSRMGGNGPPFVTYPLGRLSFTRLVKVAANTWYHFPN